MAEEPYTPTEEIIWEAFEYWSYGCGGAERGELDRFLNGVRAEALRKFAEDASDLLDGSGDTRWKARILAEADRIDNG